MFSNYLSSIKGISVFPVISLVIFLSAFILMVIWIIRIDKSYVKQMENLPLDEEDEHRKI
ncbi:MAG: CcoQ/FixQ family Cbb3-type cytochrome c oxidase assembly chaperone [Ignavibacteria bacterium]|nr:CcoQ/FixQ family Cbb3-type cytochrome c oxidase assembly chaperone [Ignavibacteria bacterium]